MEMTTMAAQKYFITGASGGLGLELTKKALNEGHIVVATVRKVSAMADLSRQFGDHLIVEQLDVTDPVQVQAIVSRHDNVDVIINNAGGAVIGAMEEMSDKEIQQQIDLNLLGPIYITRSFLPSLRQSGHGRLVYITSVGGRVAFAGGSMYHAAKFGLEGFAETIAQEISSFGIKTLIVEPGSMQTNFINNTNWTAETDTYRDTTVGALRRYVEQVGENDIAGDPVKMADAIYILTQQAEPPLRTALGVDTYATLEKAYAESLKALQHQKMLAQSVAFAGKTGFVPTI